MLFRTILLGSVAAGLVASAGSAAAQEAAKTDDAALAPVIVTARRVEENLQKVPATVTAVNAEQLRQQNIVTVADLATVTPSLTIATYFNDLNARFAVRGLTTGVVTYFADAPCCGGTASAPFMDIASTQVLNGPQGTLFGRSSAAGAVLIYPQRPVMNEFGGSVDVTAGDYSRAQFTGVLNVPLITDHLALRVAANSNHVDGYTSLFGRSDKLDGVNNQQYRIGLEFKAGGFDNYLVANYLNIDQSGTSLVLAAYNPKFALYNLPASAVPATFGAVCGQAVAQGFAADVASCEADRYAILQQIGQRLKAESARVGGGGSAVRSTYPPYDNQPLLTQEHHGSLVNVTEYDFGDLGPAKLNVKNIFSYDSFTSNAATTNDGIGGLAEEGAFANAQYSVFGANNELGNQLTPDLGPPMKTYTEELQVHLNLNNGLLRGTAGYFYQDQKVPRTTGGTTNVYKLFGGVLNPNLGYNNAVGFVDDYKATERAWYAQATLDLSTVGVRGLSLTAGYRHSWDKTSLTTSSPVLTATGAYAPGSTASTNATSSDGYNYTLSASEQFTDHLMGYVTVSRAYVPGGVNQLGQAATSLPNYTPTYAPETVLEYEVGLKADFAVAGMLGRVNADVYNNDFTDIAETLTGLVGTTSVRYNENIAGARLRGFEIAGTLLPTSRWEVDFGYSYNDAKYTSWTGSDPFNVAKPGDPLCVSSSPAGQCYLDLTNNPFPFMPAHQGHLTIAYTMPLPDDHGDLRLSAVGYAQSRVYYEATAARDLQLLPGGLDGISQPGYATLNLRADWRNVNQTGWNAAVFVNNATDEVYASGKVPQLETLGFAAANYAPPRMFGFEVWKHFGP